LPQASAPPHPAPQALAPHGLQLEAQGAEQHRLTFLPKQPPASAEAAIETTTANESIKRMLFNSSKLPKSTHTAKSTWHPPSE